MTGEDALVFLGFARFLMNERVDVQKVTAEDLWMSDRRSTFPKITEIFDQSSVPLTYARETGHPFLKIQGRNSVGGDHCAYLK